METAQSAQIRDALENLSVLQSMISLSAERLDGLRTQCATTAEITQQEIRTLEVNIWDFNFNMCSLLCFKCMVDIGG